MTLLLTIYKLGLRFVYFFMKLLPTKQDQIVFLSRQANEPTIDYLYLEKEIKHQYPNTHIVMLTKRMEKNNLGQIISYAFHPLEQMYYLATSRVCVVDGYQIVVSCLHHKKGLKVVQIWHSLAAIKKFGKQILYTEKDRKVAEIMHMHEQYDVVISGSEYMKPFFAKAFGCDEKIIRAGGLPRVDYLLETVEENKKKVLSYYPELENKKVVLYVPTFRTYDEYRIDELIQAFENTEYELVIKIHPRMKIVVDPRYTYDKVDSLEMLSVADYVISDYSAISVEAAVLNKPLLLFAYDMERYAQAEGLNVDLHEELPGYVFTTAMDIANCLETQEYDMEKLERFKKLYVINEPGTCTKRLVNIIMEEK